MTGIADDSGGTLTATGVVISGDDVGISVEGGSTATITGSSITGDYTGIWVANAGTATVTQSAITGCMTGILVGNGGGDVSTLTAQQDRTLRRRHGRGGRTGPDGLDRRGGRRDRRLVGQLARTDQHGQPRRQRHAASPLTSASPPGSACTLPAAGTGFDPTGITLYAVPTQLVFVTEPSSTANSAQAFATQPVVEAEDASGNLGINFDYATTGVAGQPGAHSGGIHRLAFGHEHTERIERRSHIQRFEHQSRRRLHADRFGVTCG